MINFFFSRWIVARRFEKTDAGYIYRHRPDLPGFVANESDRTDVLRAWRGAYVRWWLRMLSVTIAGLTVIILLALGLHLSETNFVLATYGWAAVLLLYFIRAYYRLLRLPETMLVGHPQVAPTIPSSGWRARFHHQIERRSWPVQIGLTAVYGTATAFIAPRTLNAAIAHWIIFACFALSLLVLLYGASWKARRAD